MRATTNIFRGGAIYYFRRQFAGPRVRLALHVPIN